MVYYYPKYFAFNKELVEIWKLSMCLLEFLYGCMEWLSDLMLQETILRSVNVHKNDEQYQFIVVLQKNLEQTKQKFRTENMKWYHTQEPRKTFLLGNLQAFNVLYQIDIQ